MMSGRFDSFSPHTSVHTVIWVFQMASPPVTCVPLPVKHAAHQFPTSTRTMQTLVLTRATATPVPIEMLL